MTDHDHDPILALLQTSLNEKRGVTIHFPGGSVGARVTRITGGAVEGTSQQFERIVVRLEHVIAVTM